MTAFAATLALMPHPQLLAADPERTQVTRGDVDAALFRRAVEGRDEAAWQCVVEEHYPAVLRQAMRACGDAAAAEDIAQEVFLKVFRAGRSFRGDRPLGHWIARITTTTAIDVLRRSRAAHTELDEARATAAADDPAREVDRAESRRRVRDAVLRLPAHLREVVWLTTFAELSYEAAARELGIPLRTAISRAMTARAQLRRSLVGLEDVA